MGSRRLFAISVVALAVLLAWRWEHRPIRSDPGVLAADPPRQGPVENAPFELDGYRITPRASFSLRARVLSTERYWLGRESDLSPIDLALGWGPMSDQRVLDQIDVSQSGRWYYLKWPLTPPVPEQLIMSSSANMHMIPSAPWIAKVLEGMRPGELVELRGELVDVDGPDGWRWRTSLSRDDRGGGSCELFYVDYASAGG